MKFPKHLNPPELLKGKFCLLGLLEGIFGVLWVPLSVWFLRGPWESPSGINSKPGRSAFSPRNCKVFVLRAPATQTDPVRGDRLKTTRSEGQETQDRGGRKGSGPACGSQDTHHGSPTQVCEPAASLAVCQARSIDRNTAVLRAPGSVESRALLAPAVLELTVCGRDTRGRKSDAVLVGKREKGWMRFTGGSGHRKGVRPEAGKSGRSP